MGKIVFWLVVFFVVLFALRLINVAKNKARQPRPPPPGATPPAAMVRCAECGVFVPKADAHPVPEGFHCGTVNCSQPRRR